MNEERHTNLKCILVNLNSIIQLNLFRKFVALHTIFII